VEVRQMNLLDDPNNLGMLSLGLRLMSTPGKFGPALGQAGLGAIGDIQQAKAAQQAQQAKALQQRMLEMQMQQIMTQQQQRQQAEAAQAQAQQQRGGYLDSLNQNAGPARPFNPAEALQAGLSPQEIGLVAPKQPDPVDWNKMVVTGPDGQPMLNPLYIQGKKATQQPGTVVNVGGGQKDANWGTPPKDYVWARDAAGNVMTERDPKSGAFRPIAAPVGGGGQADQQNSAIATMEDTLRVLDKAISHPGRSVATGLSGAIDPRNILPGSEATNFRILADQIGGKAFLQAFESLKGGGQITEAEGKKATDAIARLNRAQSDSEYLQALQDFRDVVAGAYSRASGGVYSGGQPAQSGFSDADKERRYQEWKRQQGK
jgi:hypothetical protein